MKVVGVGPTEAQIMLVGEAPGKQEEAQGRPFVGASGAELRRMCQEAGIMFEATWRTNVCRYRPPNNDIKEFFLSKTAAHKKGLTSLGGRYPDAVVRQGLTELEREIAVIQPKLIIALGETALWALTELSKITSWRGSQLYSTQGIKTVPTYHPAAILRQWSWRAVAVMDLRRAREWLDGKREPTDHLIEIAPAYRKARHLLEILLATLHSREGRPIAVDIETRAGFTSCLGLATGPDWGLVLPWMSIENPEGFYSLEEEAELRRLIRKIFTHPNAQLIFQNGIYDCQYFMREESYCPHVTHDTMLAQHALFPGTPKALHHLASLYQDNYVFWKEESKEWDPKVGELQLWAYNAKDLIATWEVHNAQQRLLDTMRLRHVYNHLMQLYEPVLSMMILGFRWDSSAKEELGHKLSAQMNEALRRLSTIFGHEVNPRSPYQLKELFYGDFGLPSINHPKTGKPTLDEAALTKIKEQNPVFERPIDLILGYRQDSVTKSTFLGANPSPDGRFHCSFNIGGTKTFRFSSSENAFHEGTNGQNLSPVVRKLLIPDPGYELEERDLAGADAQVVAWETGDEELKEIFKADKNLHIANARALFPEVSAWSDEAIRASDGSTQRYKRYYYLAKTGVHATNYGVHDRTLSRTLGISVKDAGSFRARWFDLHPRILEWHKRVEEDLRRTRSVYNAFGFRYFFFDRIDVSSLQDALAWVPQSTVAVVCAKAMIRLYRNVPEVEMLLQVHDSVVMQIPLTKAEELYPQISSAFEVSIPYEDPLIIPTKPKRSRESWGAVT